MAELLGKTIVVSGGAGFLASHVAAVLAQAGMSAVLVDLAEVSDRHRRVLAALGVADSPCRGLDLARAEAWQWALEAFRPDIVLHLAGAARRGSGAADWHQNARANVCTTLALIEAAGSLPAAVRPAVVHAGSQSEYGLATPPWREPDRCMPADAYGATKLSATELLLAAGRSGLFRACVARLPVAYGPAQGPTMFIPQLIAAVLRGEEFRMTEGLQRRRFVYAADAARLLLELAAGLLRGEAPEVVNLPASPPVAMRTVAEMLVEYLDRPAKLVVGAIPLRPDELLDAWPDDSLALSHGLRCQTALEVGLRETVRWYCENAWFFEERG